MKYTITRPQIIDALQYTGENFETEIKPWLEANKIDYGVWNNGDISLQWYTDFSDYKSTATLHRGYYIYKYNGEIEIYDQPSFEKEFRLYSEYEDNDE